MEAPCFIFGCYILLLGDAAGRRARGATGAVQLGAPHNLQNHPHASRRRTLQVRFIHHIVTNRMDDFKSKH